MAELEIYSTWGYTMKKRSRKAKPKPALQPGVRALKTKSFARESRKEGISDQELCEALAELSKGQGDNLGGNVWKKRLNKNRHRAIAIESPERFWVLVYLFAKQDRKNIEDDELAGFKKLAKDYLKANDAAINNQIANGDLEEICNERKEDH